MAEQDFEEMIMDMEETSAIEDVAADNYRDPLTGHIVQFVKDKYSKADTARQLDEERWIQAYRNYRGLYGPDVQFTSTEKSRVFVKVTKTKVLAAYGQIAEVLFGGNKRSMDGDLSGGYYVEPTAFKGNNKMRIFQEEIFGLKS